MQDFTEISYVIDAEDRLVKVSREWAGFALKNEGEAILAEHVIGRSLWDFITDDPTRELYEAVLDHVRRGENEEFVLRCDAPERRRLIEMIVTRRPDGNVEFKTLLLPRSHDSRSGFLPNRLRGAAGTSWCAVGVIW